MPEERKPDKSLPKTAPDKKVPLREGAPHRHSTPKLDPPKPWPKKS